MTELLWAILSLQKLHKGLMDELTAFFNYHPGHCRHNLQNGNNSNSGRNYYSGAWTWVHCSMNEKLLLVVKDLLSHSKWQLSMCLPSQKEWNWLNVSIKLFICNLHNVTTYKMNEVWRVVASVVSGWVRCVYAAVECQETPRWTQNL